MPDNTKSLNVRLKLKYDSYENWHSNNPQLLAGEVAVVYIPTDKSVDIDSHVLAGTQPPHILMKVGDGTNKFDDLQWVSAKAADVNSYAKLTATTFETQIKALASAELSQSIRNNADAIDALEALVGSDTVTKQIADAITALDLANTYAAKEHTHTKADITDFNHTHEIAEVNGLQNALDGKQAAGDYAAEVHTHVKEDITDFEHTHTVAEVTDFAEKVEAYNYATKTEAQGYADAKDEAIAAAKKAGDDAAAAVAAHATEAGNTYETKMDASTKLAEAKKYTDDAIDALPAQTDYTVSIEEDTTDSTIAKRYIFKQLGEEIGRIDLAKELVVTSGSVKEVTEADMPYAGAVVGDKYIELVIANQETPIYVPAKDLVDIYTAKDNAAEVQVAISNANEISATLVNGGITEEKFNENIKTKLNKVWEEVGVAAGLVEALENGQVKTNKEAIDAINNESTGILKQAKTYSDGLNTAMDNRVKVLEDIDHDAYKAADEALKSELEGKINAIDNHSHDNKTVIDGITAEKVSAWDSAEQNAKDYADGLADNYAEAEHTHEIADVTGLQDALDAKANDTDLAAIAKSGTTDDLAQGTKVLIFDCGTSAI